jgi:NAD(P)-dependent dehydrogenase (short-subunit alcohol dehydrogenase family)
MHGRDADRGAQVVAHIERAGGAATFLRADLASLAEVRDLAAAVQHTTDRLDILINNAGIGTAGGVRQESADGFELRFAVNYLAGFLLTSLLLPLLRAAEPARIVNVSSAGQEAIDFADVMLTRGYNGARAYCQSKHHDPRTGFAKATSNETTDAIGRSGDKHRTSLQVFQALPP